MIVLLEWANYNHAPLSHALSHSFSLFMHCIIALLGRANYNHVTLSHTLSLCFSLFLFMYCIVRVSWFRSHSSLSLSLCLSLSLPLSLSLFQSFHVLYHCIARTSWWRSRLSRSLTHTLSCLSFSSCLCVVLFGSADYNHASLSIFLPRHVLQYCIVRMG